MKVSVYQDSSPDGPRNILYAERVGDLIVISGIIYKSEMLPHLAQKLAEMINDHIVHKRIMKG